MKQSPEVLVVHCVDTEGPIGGDVRRRPDGSREFMDSWTDIGRSIRRLTSQSFRKQLMDSWGKPYLYNWFIMDFTGFSTNPKRRVAKYNDTYDHFKSFPTQLDGFYWHYHHPPADGVGDHWSDRWSSSQEYLNILLHRLVERGDWPEAFRAGGTIEDNEASLWLEDNVLIDFSNRVSAVSQPTDNIFDFNWYGARDHWGYYHPSRKNLLQTGTMRRFIARSVDLWSRLHVLTVEEVRAAFAQAATRQGPVILSYFSHDHRDMRDETIYAASLIKQVSKETSIPWRAMQALPAVQQLAGLKPVSVKVKSQRTKDGFMLSMSRPIYQPKPWVGAKLQDGSLQWLPVTALSKLRFEVALRGDEKKIVVGGTSLSGNKFVKMIKRV